MTAKNRTDLKSDVSTRIISGSSSTTAENVRLQYEDNIDSALNIIDTTEQSVASTVDFTNNLKINAVTLENYINQVVNFETNYLNGFRIEYLSSNTISVNTGQCRDSTDSYNIRLTTNLTLDISTTGVLGLDTGVETADTWYYIYIINDSTGTNSVGAVLSVNSSAPTLPAGYDSFRLIGSVRNDSSSDLISFICNGAGRNKITNYNTNKSDVIVLNTGTATTFTTIDLSSYVPINAVQVELLIDFTSNNDDNDASYFRPTGSTVTEAETLYIKSSNKRDASPWHNSITIPLIIPQSIDYSLDNGNVSLYIISYTQEF